VAEGNSVVEFSAPAYLYSISQLANEFQRRRETIAKRLAHANVEAAGIRKGYPVYRLPDAAIAIFGPETPAENGAFDPNDLPLEKRGIWYQSEMRRLSVERTAAAYLPASEHYEGLRMMAGTLIEFLKALPLQLEASLEMSPEQLDEMRGAIDRVRIHLVEQASAYKQDEVSSG